MAKTDIEVWESTVAGTTWIQVEDKRNGGYKSQRIGGKGTGTARVTLTRDEREYNQEIIPEGNQHLDPFNNGILVCIKGREENEKGRYELTDDDLKQILAIEQEDVFEETIRGIEIQLPLRRLLDLAEKYSTVPRYRFIRDVIDERYRVGGTQRTVEEMIKAGEKIGSTIYT
jgi:DNA/RNA endonuclease YhcR with UshA esterase domain